MRASAGCAVRKRNGGGEEGRRGGAEAAAARHVAQGADSSAQRMAVIECATTGATQLCFAKEHLARRIVIRTAHLPRLPLSRPAPPIHSPADKWHAGCSSG